MYYFYKSKETWLILKLVLGWEEITELDANFVGQFKLSNSGMIGMNHCLEEMIQMGKRQLIHLSHTRYGQTVVIAYFCPAQEQAWFLNGLKKKQEN